MVQVDSFLHAILGPFLPHPRGSGRQYLKIVGASSPMLIRTQPVSPPPPPPPLALADNVLLGIKSVEDLHALEIP
jgi:hypothetical protein